MYSTLYHAKTGLDRYGYKTFLNTMNRFKKNSILRVNTSYRYAVGFWACCTFSSLQLIPQSSRWHLVLWFSSCYRWGLVMQMVSCISLSFRPEFQLKKWPKWLNHGQRTNTRQLEPSGTLAEQKGRTVTPCQLVEYSIFAMRPHF